MSKRVEPTFDVAHVAAAILREALNEPNLGTNQCAANDGKRLMVSTLETSLSRTLTTASESKRNARCVGGKSSPSASVSWTARAAEKERDSEAIFEQLDLLTHSSWRDVQLCGSGLEAREPRRSLESMERAARREQTGSGAPANAASSRTSTRGCNGTSG